MVSFEVCIVKSCTNSLFLDADKLLSIKRLAKVAEDLLKVSLDAVASTVTFTLLEILQEPLIVEKLRAEIKEVSNENGQLKFEELNGLRYMDMCLKGMFNF